VISQAPRRHAKKSLQSNDIPVDNGDVQDPRNARSYSCPLPDSQNVLDPSHGSRNVRSYSSPFPDAPPFTPREDLPAPAERSSTIHQIVPSSTPLDVSASAAPTHEHATIPKFLGSVAYSDDDLSDEDVDMTELDPIEKEIANVQKEIAHEEYFLLEQQKQESVSKLRELLSL